MAYIISIISSDKIDYSIKHALQTKCKSKDDVIQLFNIDVITCNSKTIKTFNYF